jgi:hypothetical protein
MNALRPQRWDLVFGALASLVAIAGFLLSVRLGNTASLGLGNFHCDTQKFMAMLAAMFLILVAIKAGLRYRKTGRTSPTTCGWNFERMLNLRRRMH